MVKEDVTIKSHVSSQFKKGILELCILTLLTRKDYYGYELVEAISEKVEIAEGTVYPILRRLTQEKYFETYLKESNEGPPRKYYRLTKSGREAQADLYSQWKEFNKNVLLLLKMGEKNEQNRIPS